MSEGFYRALPPDHLTVIVNTGDDFHLYGLAICPDLDTVMYGLADLRDQQRGWGVTDESFRCLEMLDRLGGETWFQLGDQDLAVHLRRAELLADGLSLTRTTRSLCQSLGIQAAVLPMCDRCVSTEIRTEGGEWLDFQDYFVRRGHRDRVAEVRFPGVEKSRLSEAVNKALDQAELLVVCPSNPFLSVDPILAVTGMRDRLQGLSCPRVGISPIVGGVALKGPAGAMLESLGHEASALGVARLYADWLDAFVIDSADQALAGAIKDLGLRCLACPTVMTGVEEAAQLASRILEFAP